MQILIQLWCHADGIVQILVVDIREYRIARNIGGGKHWRIWRIELRFAKIFPSNVFKSINLISHDPIDLTHGSFEHGCG